MGTLRQQSLKDVDVTASKYFKIYQIAVRTVFSASPSGSGRQLLRPCLQQYFIPILVKKDDNGKPITQPRQFQTNPPKQGKTKTTFFSDLGYITIGDKYQDQYKLSKIDEMQKKSKMPKDVAEFKYSSGYKTV